MNSGRLPVVAAVEAAATEATSTADAKESMDDGSDGAADASSTSSPDVKKPKSEVQYHIDKLATFGAIVDRIADNDPTVTFVRICDIHEADRFVDLARAVADNTHLKTLILGSTKMEVRGMMALAKALERNRTLTAFRCVYDESIVDGRWGELTEAIVKSPTLQEAVLSHSFTLSDNVAAIMGEYLSENRSLRRLWFGQLSGAGCGHMAQVFSAMLPGNIRALDFELYDIQGNKVRYEEWEEIMERNREFSRWLDDYDFDSLYDLNQAVVNVVKEVMHDYYRFDFPDTDIDAVSNAIVKSLTGE